MPHCEEELRGTLRLLQRKYERSLAELREADLIRQVNARILSAADEAETMAAMFSGFAEADFAAVFARSGDAWRCMAARDTEDPGGLVLPDQPPLGRAAAGRSVILPDLQRLWSASRLPRGWAGYRGCVLMPFPGGDEERVVLLLSEEHGRWQQPDAKRLLKLTECAAMGMETIARMQAERSRLAAEAASQAKSSFLANMSHEIRTPMNAVLGMADLLIESDLPARQRGYAEVIHSSGQALITVINDILDFSKIEAGRIELESAPFDPRAVAEDIVGLLAPGAQQKGLEVMVRCAAEVPRAVQGDAARLRQVLTNLLGNAIKFTAAGHVLVEVGCTAIADGRAQLRFSVQDTGIGVAADKLEAIFGEFSQAESATTREFGGTGLGLSISARLIGLMGGRIAVASEPGTGSTFTVHLEAEICEPAGGAPAPLTPLPALRVLLVDDVAVNLDILEEHCLAWGLRPSRAESGAAAIAALRRAAQQGAPFDLVLLDYHMPGMDGLAVADHIHASRDLAPLSVVILSSADDDAVMAAFRARGTDAYLVKPIRPGSLYRRLAETLGTGPACSPRPAGGEGGDGRRREADPSPIRVLAADDNAVNRMVLEQLVDRSRYALTFAADGAEAVQAFEAAPCDIVLMDLSMPRLDGYQATRAIREIERRNGLVRTPIICLTAHALAGQEAACLENDMDDYLSKPVRKHLLDSALARWSARLAGLRAACTGETGGAGTGA